MGFDKYVLMTEKNRVITEAYLVFSNDSGLVFRILSKEMAGRLAEMKRIRYQKQETYAETFEGDIYDMKLDKIYVDNIQNVSATMRSEVKVKVKFNTTISVVDETEDEEGELVNLNVAAKDISCGGFCFHCGKELDTNYLYETIIPLWDEPMIVNFRILRKVFVPETEEYSYGCQFENLNYQEERVLREAIFRLQMMMHRKQRRPGQLGGVKL